MKTLFTFITSKSMKALFLGLVLVLTSQADVFAGCTNPPAPSVSAASGTNCNGTCLNFTTGGGSSTALILQYDDNAAFTSPTQVVLATSATSSCVTSAAGTTVYWRIRAVDCSGPCTCYSAYTSGTSVVIPACPATSDNCAGAIAMAFQSTGSGAWTCSTTTGATASADANPACWTGNTLEDVWYRVTISGTNLLVTTDQSNTTAIDSQVAIYPSCGGAIAACSMDAALLAEYTATGIYPETSTGASALATGLTSGNTYYIRVDGDAAIDGFFCLKATGTPSNNCYASATALAAGVSVNGSIYGATEDCDGAGGTADCDLDGSNSVIDCGPGGGASVENNVWYTIPCATTGTYTLNLTSVSCNGGNGLQLWASLTNASCATFNAQANDGGNGEFCNNTAAVSASMSSTFTCNAGQTTRVTVDGFAGEMCSFGISFTAPVLPVSLVSFNGAYSNKMSNLTWVTASERDNDYFAVEKSLDGINFYEIGKVDSYGDGNSSDTYIYNYSEYPAETEAAAYYRLRQVDLNGIETTFDPTYVLFDEFGVFTLTPNPTQNSTLVQFKSHKASDAVLTIHDVNGRLIGTEQFVAAEGNNEHQINLGNNQNGIYFVTLTLGDKVFKSKLMKSVD